MPDYSKTVIYVIKCKDETKTDVYVGSTCSFKQRIRQHKCASKFDKFKLYDYIQENGGWENFECNIYEEYPCENVQQCRIKEREVYEKLKATLNSQKPHRDKGEYYEENKQDILEKQKLYNKDPLVTDRRHETQKNYRDDPINKEKLREKNKQYVEENKEHIADYKKQWGQINQERRKETNKLRYETKKEEISAKRKENYEKNKIEIQLKRKETATEEHREKARVRAKEYNAKRKAEGFKRVLTEEQKAQAVIRAKKHYLAKKATNN
jgi:hypothetical protein